MRGSNAVIVKAGAALLGVNGRFARGVLLLVFQKLIRHRMPLMSQLRNGESRPPMAGPQQTGCPTFPTANKDVFLRGAYG